MWRALSKPSPRKRRSMFTAARKSEETLRCFCAGSVNFPKRACLSARRAPGGGRSPTVCDNHDGFDERGPSGQAVGRGGDRVLRREVRPRLARRSFSGVGRSTRPAHIADSSTTPTAHPTPLAPSDPRRPAARRLYGAFDVGRLVERATVAVVAEEGGAVVAFLAVTARAPMPDTSGADGHHDASARLAWAKRTALELCSPGGTRFECGSTLWLAACATAPALQVSARAVLRRMLRECFARAPLAPRALFFAGPNAVEQTPIGSLIEKRATNTDGMTTDKSSDEKKTKFALYSCARKALAPAPIARDARLEDYDDLFSLAAHASAASGRGGPRALSFGFSFDTEDQSHENENDTSTADSTLRAMSSLIAEARRAPETRRVLVAFDDDGADDGSSSSKIVALMAVTTEGVLEDAMKWSLTHDTAAYDDFAKPEEVEDEGDAEEEREETKEELRGSVPSEADRDASEEATTISKPFDSSEPSNDTKRTRTNDAFRVVAFASLPGYDVSTAVPLLDAAFARFEEVDFCVAAVPAEAREVPFTTHEMVRVPFRPGMGAFADQVLYARHREADAPGFEIRPGAREDAAEVASLLLGTPRADARVETFEAAAAAGYSRDEQKSVPEENASASKNASLRAFVATCDGQVVGYLILDLAAHAFARLARRRFRLDEVVDEPDESAFALLVAYELNPVFAHRRRRVGFMLEALRLAGKACALYAHSLEEAPAENGDLDEAEASEEPRRLPDVAARDFRMARSRRLESLDPENENRDDANHALFVFTSRVAASPRRVVDAKVLVVGGDDVALAAAETLAAHESLLFESVSLAAPAGGVYPGGFPVSSAYCSCVSGSTTGHASLAKLALGLDRVAYHEADLESVVFDEASGARHARFADGGEQRFDALLLCLASRDETRRAVLGDGCDDDPDVRDTPVERLDDFVQQVSGMPTEDRNELVENCECVLVYGATLDALGASRTLAWLGFEPGSVLRVVPEATDITHEDEDAEDAEDVEGVERKTRAHEGESNSVSERLASFAEWAASSTKGLGLDALSLPGQPPAMRGLALAGCEACVLRSGAAGVRAYFSDTRTGAVTAVEATALLGCDERDVDQRLFAALDSFGLVTDGGVVVDGAFRTNDARVFAAGDVAKFSRSVLSASKAFPSKPLSSTGTGGEGDRVVTKPSKEKKRRKPFARAMRLRDARECGDALAFAVAARFADDSLFFDESVSSMRSTSPMRYGTETKRTRAFETTNDAPVFARARVEAVTLPSGAFFFRAATPDALAPAAEGAFGGSNFKTRTTRFNGVFCRVETDARDVIVSLSYCGPFVDARRHARCVGLPASLFFTDDEALPEASKESSSEKEKEDDAFCLWSALCRPAASALFHEDFLEAFNDAKRKARRERDLGELKKEDMAAAAQENAIAFVGKRAKDLPAYHDVLFGGGVTA